MTIASKGTRRKMHDACVLCGAKPHEPCVKGHVSPGYGSTKQKRAPHVVYPGQKP